MGPEASFVIFAAKFFMNFLCRINARVRILVVNNSCPNFVIICHAFSGITTLDAEFGSVIPINIHSTAKLAIRIGTPINCINTPCINVGNTISWLINLLDSILRWLHSAMNLFF